MGWIPYTTVLVIPTGATSGQRIVIDGTNGQIVMYDVNNAPVIVESASAGTLAIKSADGTSTMTIGRVNDPMFGVVPGIGWASTNPPSAAPGVMSLAYQAGPLGQPTGYVELTPARMAGDTPGLSKTSFVVAYLENDGNVVADSYWFWGEAGGQQTIKAVDPAYITDGAFHLFAGAEWTPIVQVVPPSATIECDIYMTGHNASNAGNTIAVGLQIDLVSPPTLIQAAALGTSAFVTAPAAAFTAQAQAFARVTIGSSVLGGYIGQQIRITPAYRATSGSGGANVQVSVGRLTVRPATYGI